MTFSLPETIYDQIQRMAQRWHKPDEHVLVDTVVTGITLLDDIPEHLVNDMSALLLLNDAALWKAACRTLSTDE
ncbi:MAG: hypothetical protein AAF639_25750 [Chloroflexota bacterium]